MPAILGIRQAERIMPKDVDETWKFFMELGNIDGNVMLARSYQGIKDAWRGQPCFVVGAGFDLKPFVSEVGWSFLDGKHSIGINHTIEDYDRFEWFLFLDKRFLLKTTYPMARYTGRIFAHCNTGLKPSGQVTVFHTSTNHPTSDVKDGLYRGTLSGLCAVNLALISGADPIYLLGMGMGMGATATAYHYKDDYTGEAKERKVFDKFVRVMRHYDAYAQYANRFVQVTDGKEPRVFTTKISVKELASRFPVAPRIEVKGRVPSVVHVSFSGDIAKHADITRYVIGECYGKHTLVSQNERLPDADLYIMEHFLSTQKYANAFSFKGKAIDIVHTVNCIPKPGYRKVIALTNAWRKVLDSFFVSNVEVIHGGIDTKQFLSVSPDYDKPTFGRITRYSPAKIHPAWNGLVERVLSSMPSAECTMFTQLDSTASRPTLKHARMHYDSACQISMFKGEFLKRLSVYVHMNGSFKETLSFAVLEAMATGLPIVYLDEGTGVLDEITGGTQIKCHTPEAVEQAIMVLLHNPKLKAEYGARAREQVKRFDKQIMVAKFDTAIRECLQ